MKEVQVCHDLYILPISRAELTDRLCRATDPEDRFILVTKANEFHTLGDDHCRLLFGLSRSATIKAIQEKNPSFDPGKDYIFINNEIRKKNERSVQY